MFCSIYFVTIGKSSHSISLGMKHKLGPIGIAYEAFKPAKFTLLCTKNIRYHGYGIYLKGKY